MTGGGRGRTGGNRLLLVWVPMASAAAHPMRPALQGKTVEVGRAYFETPKKR